MTRIALLTVAYPYLPGEQFIEEEIRYWARQPGVELVVMPMSADGAPRTMPGNVRLDLSLARGRQNAPSVRYFMQALFSGVLWRELAYVLRHKGPSPYCLARAGYASAKLLHYRDALLQPLQRDGGFHLLYCYWNDTPSLAAALLKRQGKLARLVTRIHNYELYECQAPRHYMPLKRQFIGEFDRFFPISDQGARYLQQTFGVPAGKTAVSRLGVSLPDSHHDSIPGLLPEASSSGTLQLVSISYCVDAKRVDVIIDGVAQFAAQHPELEVCWTHIGDGPLHAGLRRHAASRMALPNLRWQMPGQMANADVQGYLGSVPVDLLLNASKNEGVPVSIMEAMSHGIPAIAPDTGGLRELVSDDCGRLLRSNPGPDELAAAISDLLPELKQQAIRCRARDKVCQDYCAAHNYPMFISEVQQIALARSQAGSRVLPNQQAHAHSSTLPD
jgi:glycosyltransferase involved in cell wall biosynthesis